MNFARPKPRRPSEPALPMINVVFLLLIFFLMSAQIAPPPLLAVTPPRTEAPNEAKPEARAEHTLYLGAKGEIAFGPLSGDAVWAALRDLPQAEGATLHIRADAALPADDLARALSRASVEGFDRIFLVTAPR